MSIPGESRGILNYDSMWLLHVVEVLAYSLVVASDGEVAVHAADDGASSIAVLTTNKHGSQSDSESHMSELPGPVCINSSVMVLKKETNDLRDI